MGKNSHRQVPKNKQRYGQRGHIHPYSVPYSSINHGTFFFGEYGNKCDFHVGEKDDTGIPGLVFTFTENELERSTIFGG